MSGFDKVYNDECARLWNPPADAPIKYEVQKWWYTQKWDVIARKEGLGICVEVFETKEAAEACRDKLQKEYDEETE
jgi:hypothetical protein